MATRFCVEKVQLSEKVSKEFRRFTQPIVGRGLVIPDDNDVFFGYKEIRRGLLSKIIMSRCQSLLC